MTFLVESDTLFQALYLLFELVIALISLAQLHGEGNFWNNIASRSVQLELLRVFNAHYWQTAFSLTSKLFLYNHRDPVIRYSNPFNVTFSAFTDF